MTEQRLRAGVIYGGRSVEHEVSVITALQVMQALDPDRFEIHPIYITRRGNWIYDRGLFTGDRSIDLRYHYQLELSPPRRGNLILSADPTDAGALLKRGAVLFRGTLARLDVVIPATHGSNGEDGSLQGLLELSGIPYVGSRVRAAALGMDKLSSKTLLRAAGLPVIPCLPFSRVRWSESRAEVLRAVLDKFSLPVVVKPRGLGSSIGVAHAADVDALSSAIDVALEFDTDCLVESAIANAADINCAVLGRREGPFVSECERPVRNQLLLQFEDKYFEGAGQGMTVTSEIPAQLDSALREQIRALAAAAFSALECEGIARVDLLVTADDVFVNEVNTIPGSYSIRLWEASGIGRRDLFNELVDLALARRQELDRTNYGYKSDLLRLAASKKLGEK